MQSCPTLNQIQHLFQANGATGWLKNIYAEVQFWLNLSVLHSPSQKSCKFLLFKLLGYPQSVHQTPHWIQHPHRPTRWPPKNLHDGFHGTPHLTGTYDWHVVCLHDWLILIWIQRKKYICSPCMDLMGGSGKTKLPKDESPVASGRRFWFRIL